MIRSAFIAGILATLAACSPAELTGSGQPPLAFDPPEPPAEGAGGAGGAPAPAPEMGQPPPPPAPDMAPAPACGDGACDPNEGCDTCPADCGACPAECGDGACNGVEACEVCPEDCGACPPACGDGQCNGAEACEDCPQDCGACAPVCGDGQCNGAEACGDCPQDCGACPPMCGDGRCEAPEDCDACPQDCGLCGWPEDLARSEEALLVMVNDQRAQGANCGGAQMPPVGPLTMNAELREAARLHSQDMGENNYFSHTGLNGSSFSQRARDAGYRGFPGGENIAAGNGPAQATFNQWLNSPGHCQNMMRGRFREIGVGHAEVRGSRYTHYWTQVFGQ